MQAIRSLGALSEADVFTEVTRLFLDDASKHLSALEAAIAAGCPELVEAIAHRLRGGALEMGALRMAPLCLEIEHAARARALDDVATQVRQLTDEFAAARVALERAIG
jgi:HPt (histidine-containing phosphotransfer) domain-containing protein